MSIHKTVLHSKIYYTRKYKNLTHDSLEEYRKKNYRVFPFHFHFDRKKKIKENPKQKFFFWKNISINRKLMEFLKEYI